MRIKIIFLLLTICICTNANAQDSHASTYVWKRTVRRIIDAPKTDTTRSDTTLAEMIIRGVKAEKIRGYKMWDNAFSHPMTLDDILEKNVCRLDSIIIADPKTGEETIRPNIRKEFDFRTVTKFAVQEDWTFDPLTDKTEIQVTGLAPQREIYGEDSVYRGRTSMIWVRFNDVRTVIGKYDRSHPESTFARQIWKDYFLVDATNSEFHQRVIRIIDLGEKEDTIDHHLSGSNPPGVAPLFEMMSTAIHKYKATAWADNNFTKIRANGDIQGLLSRTDTISELDPLTAREKQVIVSVDDYDPTRYSQYQIMENWKFDPVSVKTEISIVAIGPSKIKFYKHAERYSFMDSEPMFWLRYEDAGSIMNLYDQYMPTHSIAGHIWNNYFFSDVKPQILK